MVKKIALICMSVLIILSGSNHIAVAMASSTDQIEYVGNDFVSVYVDQNTGRFSIETKEGHPLKTSDNQEALLYGDGMPDTSFTTFRIDGEDYIYGNNYEFADIDSYFAAAPITQGLLNQAIWHVQGLDIIQTFTLVDDPKNPNVGNVKISYEVKNTTDHAIQVGSRILLDTMLGAQDASPMSLSGSDQFIRTETDIKSNLPEYWRALDDPLLPKVVSYGFLQGWSNAKPDRMIVAHWAGISSTKWDYAIDPNLDFTVPYNVHGSADSAVALYWNPRTIAAGSEQRFETYYGLGSFITSELEAQYSTQLFAPKQLQVNQEGDQYTEQFFDIRLEIDNSTDQAEELNDVEIELGLPLELVFADDSSPYRFVEKIAKGEIKTVTWRVMANPQAMYKAVRYWGTVQAKGGEKVTLADFIVMPALSGAPPEVQVLDILPNQKYIDDQQRDIFLRGQGFNALQGLGIYNVDVSLVRERDGKAYDIRDFEVIDGQQISIQLEELWQAENQKPEPGTYTVHMDAGQYGTFTKTFELTTNKQFQSRNYGILAVVAKNQVHSIVPAKDEKELTALSKQYDKVLLKIRGDARSIIDGDSVIYEVKPGATINSVVAFDDSDLVGLQYGGSQTILIQKKPASGDKPAFVELAGTGVLSVPGLSFLAGPFKLTLNDTTEYVFTAQEIKDENQQDTMTIVWALPDWLNTVRKMSFFPVQIKDVELGENSVSFGGTVSLSFKNKEKKEGEEEFDPDPPPNKKEEKEEKKDPFKLTIDVHEARFGLDSKNNFGFRGLHAEGNVELPDDFVPGLGFGAGAHLEVDTFKGLYELEAEVKFKVIEIYGLFTIRFTESSIPILDNFEFAIGGQPGLPLIPPFVVANLTEAGGGFRDLYDTVTGNFEVLPPLTLIIRGGLDIGKIIAAEDMRLEASLRGVSFQGKFKVMGIDILKNVYGSLLVDDSRTHVGVNAKIGAELGIFDAITGEIYATLSYDSRKKGILGPIDMSGGGSVQISIPKPIPGAGTKLAEIAAYIGTDSVSARIKVLMIPIGVSYKWGDKMPDFTIFSLAPVEEIGLASYTYEDEDGVQGELTFGTNVRVGATSSDRTPGGRMNVFAMNALTGVPDQEIPLKATDYAMIELKFTDDAPDMGRVALFKPSGKEYVLEEAVLTGDTAEAKGNYLLQEIGADESDSGLVEHLVHIMIEKPESGNWIMQSDQDFSWRVLEVDDLPAIGSVDVVQNGHQLDVSWETQHSNDKQVALYIADAEEITSELTGEKVQDSGLRLVDGLSTNGHVTVEIPETFASGSYRIRAVLYDDGEIFDIQYSEDTIRIQNPYEPDAPGDVQVEAIGNGLFHVEWEYEAADSSLNPDGFIVQVLDDQGQPLPHMGMIEVSGETNEVNIGGAYVDKETGETIGMVVDQAYTISVTAFNEMDDVRIYGAAVVSEPTQLPSPKPAKITLSLSANGSGLSTAIDEDGIVKYRTNQDHVQLTMQADQNVDVDLDLNERFLLRHIASSWQETITLEEGLNVIEVLGVNEQGDVTTEAVWVEFDNVPPDLKIESPGTAYRTADSVVLVKGVTEPGSTLTVNDKVLAVDEDGQFADEVSLEGQFNQVITIISEDSAGNQSVYVSKAINLAVGALERVEIRPVAQGPAAFVEMDDLETHPVIVGETEQFQLYGIDDTGTSFAIDSANVAWDILLGDEIGKLTDDGTLTTAREGDMVIKASLAMSTDYAMEAALIVKSEVKDNGGIGGSDKGNYDDWYVPESPDASVTTRDDASNMIRTLLKSLMEADLNIHFQAFAELSAYHDTVIVVDDRTRLALYKQGLDGRIGVGVGKLRDSAPYMDTSLKLIGDIYDIRTSDPIDFTRAPELTIRFAIEDANNHPERLGIYWYNEDAERWEYIGGEVNTLNGTVTARLPHFSKYALMYNDAMRYFTDIAGRWSEDVIYRLASIGIIDGKPSFAGSWIFDPTKSITREEFVKLLIAASGQQLSNGNSDLPETFIDRDQAESWAIPYLNTAIEHGWLLGSQSAQGLLIEPQRSITRAEAAILVARMLDEQLVDRPLNGEVNRFQDSEQIPAWGKEAASILRNEGIINGYPDGTFRPQNAITREEAAAIILQMLEWQYRKDRVSS